MFAQLVGFFWFTIALFPLTFLQRVLHREIQAALLILTRDATLTMGIFSLIFLPGVFLHELSHFLMAKILRVPTGRFSIFPKPLPDGRLQLGYVETARSDIVRDSLIGAAPLIVGTFVVAYVAIDRLDMRILWDTLRHGQLYLFWIGLSNLSRVNDFYLWFYLVFAVSSTMTPSESDRHAWLNLTVVVGALLAIIWMVGAGPWFVDRIASAVSAFLSSTAVIFGLSAAIHVILIAPVALIHKLLARIAGMDVR